jgi:hypothetical protein
VPVDKDLVAGVVEEGVVDDERALFYQRLHRRHARLFLPRAGDRCLGKRRP